jgi:cold shock CspA family protein
MTADVILYRTSFDKALANHLIEVSAAPECGRHQPTRNTQPMFFGVIESYYDWKGFGFLRLDSPLPEIDADKSVYFNRRKAPRGVNLAVGQRVEFRLAPSSIPNKPAQAVIIRLLDDVKEARNGLA